MIIPPIEYDKNKTYLQNKKSPANKQGTHTLRGSTQIAIQPLTVHTATLS